MPNALNVRIFFISFTLYHEQVGRQMESGIKTLRSPLSVEFRRHCVLNGGIRRRALPRNQSEEMIEPTTSRVYSQKLVPRRHDWPQRLKMSVPFSNTTLHY